MHPYLQHSNQSGSGVVVTELVEALSEAGSFQRFAEKRLLAALEVYRQRNWRGHVRSLNCALARLYTRAQGEDTKRKRFDRLLENWSLNAKCVRAVPDADWPSSSSCLAEAEQLLRDFADMLEDNSDL